MAVPWWLNCQLMQEMQEMRLQFPGREDPLEEGMASHSSVLAWKIPRTEEPSRLQSLGSQSWTRLSTYTHSGEGDEKRNAEKFKASEI